MPQTNPNLSKFDHLVVLMLENRSFDNLLGYLYENDKPQQFIGRGNPVFRGVAGQPDLWNPDASNPPQKVYVGKAPCATPADMCNPSPDPGEGYKHVNNQIYGEYEVPLDISRLRDPARMNGFVRDFIDAIKTQERWDGVEPTYDHYRVIMNCFTPEAVPVMSGLAKAFAVSDEWFCSVPSQTFCNRSFFHSGQSHGNLTNSNYVKWQLNDHVTIFDRLTAKLGPSSAWRIYWDSQDRITFTRIIHRTLEDARYDGNFRELAHFGEDCGKGDLPAYTFIQPRLIFNHNDMHPPIFLNPFVDSSVLAGELLLHEVYEAVRTGPRWQRTLLVIIFDEHGGCYDHWPPPLGATPPVANPNYDLEEGFRFDRFGLRVPAVFVSPYVGPGTVIRASGAVPFDHTSMIKTICQRWELESLTDRDRAAPDFGDVLSLPLNRPRTEPPAFQPRPYEPISESAAHEGLLSALQKDIFKLAAHKAGTALPGLGKIGEALHWFRRSSN